MPSHNLSAEALKVVSNYLHLPIDGHAIACPYFNNKRNKVRAGLRVLLGKGSVDDILKEIELISLREKIDIKNLSDEQLTKYLIAHNIGIDCSGLVYYILKEELKEKTGKSLSQILSFPFAKNPLRKFLTKLRPVENTNVKTLAHEKNSKTVDVKDIKPADMIVIMASEKASNPDHILLVHAVEYNDDGSPQIIHYTHSFQWPTDGKFFHGVKQGKIDITNRTQNILEQTWTENGESGKTNYTYAQATSAQKTQIKRLHVLDNI